MELNILEILVVISLVQGLLFCLVILTQDAFKVKANKYLAYATFLIVYIGFSQLFLAKNLNEEYYLFDVILDEIPWISIFYIPMLIYFLKSTNHPLGKSRKLFLLATPFFIFFVLVAFVHLQFEFELIEWNFIRDNHHFIYLFRFYFSLVFNVVLCMYSYFIIKSSTINKSEKKWLKNIWLFNALLLLTWVVYDFTNEFDFINYDSENNISYPIWLGVSIYVYWLIFKGLIQLKLSQDKSEIRVLLKSKIKQGNEAIQITQKDEKINLSNSKKLHFENFLQLMNQEKLYRNSDLSRDIVAEKLELSPGYFSQLISSSSQSNFTSLINEYRINDVKLMLVNPDFDKYSIVAIGLEAGFKSKSSFYNEFKKKTGYTPNQFKLMK